MTYEEYYQKYGAQPWQEGWKDLNDWEKERIKQGIAPTQEYQGPSGTEQGMAQDWWDKYQAGPDTNIWKGLSEMLGLPAKAIKQNVMGLLGDLMQRPDFAKEYGLAASDLEREWASKASARGLLDSSGAQAALGGGLSNLMLQRASMEEGAWQNRLGLAGNVVGQGMNFADFLNTQYLQDLGLGAQALQYLGNERANQNQFNAQQNAMGAQNWSWNPVTTGDIVSGALQLGAQFMPFGNMFGGGFDFGFGGGGGGQPNFMQNFANDQNTAGNYMANYLGI